MPTNWPTLLMWLEWLDTDGGLGCTFFLKNISKRLKTESIKPFVDSSSWTTVTAVGTKRYSYKQPHLSTNLRKDGKNKIFGGTWGSKNLSGNAPWAF